MKKLTLILLVAVFGLFVYQPDAVIEVAQIFGTFLLVCLVPAIVWIAGSELYRFIVKR